MADAKTSLWKVGGVPDDLPYILYIHERRASYRYGPHFHHDFCDLTYLVAGRLTSRVNGEDVPLTAGGLVLVKKGDMHEIWGEDVEMMNLAFPSSELEGLSSVAGRGQEAYGDAADLLASGQPLFRQLPAGERPHFENAMRRLFMVRKSLRSLLMFRCFLYGALLDYLLPSVGGQDVPSGLPEWMESAVNELGRNPDLKLTQKGLLRLCGRSREHVCRAFKRQLGKTPSMVLNEHRLARAERLLSLSNKSVTEICFETDFGNLSYFNRLFLRKHGMSPRCYRKQTANAHLFGH